LWPPLNATGVVAPNGQMNGDYELKSRLQVAIDAIQSRPLSPNVNAVILINIQQFNGVGQRYNRKNAVHASIVRTDNHNYAAK